MANRPNGHSADYMLPAAPGAMAFDFPADPGAAPVLDTMRPALAVPPEHRTPTPVLPETVQYEGGGIFAAQTPGPSEDEVVDAPSARPVGLDFGPSAISAAPPAYSPMYPQMPSPPPWARGPATGPVPQRVKRPSGTLGASVVAVAAGTTLGAVFGGPFGALAGSLFGGSTVNIYRSFASLKQGLGETDREAAVSGTYAVVAIVAGAVIWAKFASSRSERAKPNSSRRRSALDDDMNSNPDACAIRKVGP